MPLVSCVLCSLEGLDGAWWSKENVWVESCGLLKWPVGAMCYREEYHFQQLL